MGTSMILSIITIAVSTIFGIVVATMGYLFRSRLERIEKDIENLQHEQTEFKMNYLDRFEKVNKNISDSKLEIMKELNKLYVKIEGKQNG